MGTMSPTQSILDEARSMEVEYNWLGVAELYEKALNEVSDDPFRSGDISERVGLAYSKAAFQADTVEVFRDTINKAIDGYEMASVFFAKSAIRPRELQSKAMALFLKLWLTRDPAARRQLVQEAWVPANQGLTTLSESGNIVELCLGYNRLVQIAEFAPLFESDRKIIEKILREATGYGERIFEQPSAVKNQGDFAASLVKTASLANWIAGTFQEVKDQQVQALLAEKYWSKANELDAATASATLSVSSYDFTGPVGSDRAIDAWKRNLDFGRKARDRLVIGTALTMLAYETAWKALGTEDPDQRFRSLEEALRLADEGRRELEPIQLSCPTTEVMWAGAPRCEYYFMLSAWESDLEKRRTLAEKALRESAELLRASEESGYPQSILNAHHVLSKVLTSAAKLETDPGKREELLKRALEQRNRNIELATALDPHGYHDLGVYQHYLADIVAELSDLSRDIKSKQSLLQTATQQKEQGIEFQRRLLPFLEQWGALSQMTRIAQRTYEYGNLLLRLRALTKNGGLARRASEAFGQAAGLFEKANLPSRQAECFWRAAQVEDEIGEHVKGQESFLRASECFKAAAVKLPQLGEFYQDHAIYMEAWSEIEQARRYHSRQENALARDAFLKAAELHKSSQRWLFLASNYFAWAKLEEAEELSRKERSAEAIKAFGEAADLFTEVQHALRDLASGTRGRVENEIVTPLVEAAGIRREYCRASIALEEAKLLDKSGDHHASSEKFGKVAESLERLIPSLNTDEDRREIKRCMTLARAWQLMMGAEVEASPGLYLEAASLFEAAKDLSQTEKGRLVALGHSRFCRALESGARFSDTRDERLHEPTMHNLESASNYYLKAGFKNASKYAEACKLLFDAYVCVDNANRERDPDKKARFYVIAEKVLEASAAHYAAAEYPGKNAEVLQLLEKVRNERELAVSLTAVLHGPSTASFVSGITTPTKKQESPVGLELFDNAHVQASLLMRNRNPHVGESCEFEVELVNAGKGPAQLVKLEELLPEGFELIGKPEAYRLEDSFLNMRGKRLDPLKTEEVKLTLKPKSQGQFTLKPRILYLDEGGKYKSHEPEPINITVKELGITGWIKGR